MKSKQNKYSQLYAKIDRKQLSEQALATLDKLRLATGNFRTKNQESLDLFQEFYDKLSEKKPTAIKGSPENKAMIKEMLKERGRKLAEGRKAKQKEKTEGKSEGNEIDANRPAKPFGWRMRGKHNYKKPTRADITEGRAYYEGRVNRADVKRKKYPMLKRGGKLEVINLSDDEKLNYFIEKQDYINKKERNKEDRKFISDMLTTTHNGKKFYSLGYDTKSGGTVFSLEEAKKNAIIITDSDLGKKWDVIIKEVGGNFGDKDFTQKSYVVMTSPLFPNEMLREMRNTLKYEDGGSMTESGKYYVMDAKDGRIVSKGFDTEEEAKVEKYRIFEMTSNPFLTQKKMANGGYMAKGYNTNQKSYSIVDENTDRIYFKSDNKNLTSLKFKEFQEIYPNAKLSIIEFKKYEDGGYMAKGGEVHVVLNEGNGKIINKLYNDWNNVKSEQEYKKWVDEVRSTKFGTYGTITYDEVLKKFNFDNAPINSFHLKSFKAELKNALNKDYKYEDGGYMAKGGYVSKGELVWKKLTRSERMDFLNKNFTPQITPRSQETLVGKDYNFLPKNVKIVMESKYANVEDYAKGGAIENQYEGRTAEDIWDSYNKEQRLHFLYDHAEEINEYKGLEEEKENPWFNNAYKSNWNNLDKDIKNRFENHVRGGQYSNGGEMDDEEGVDLFEDYEDQPKEVSDLLETLEVEDYNYDTLNDLLSKMKKIGYTFEFGLDAEPYDLRKIGQRGKSEFYAKGGMTEHSLMIGDKIIQNAENIVVVENEGKMYVVNLNTGQRWTDMEWWQLSNRTAGKFQKMAKGGEVFYTEKHKND